MYFLDESDALNGVVRSAKASESCLDGKEDRCRQSREKKIRNLKE